MVRPTQRYAAAAAGAAATKDDLVGKGLAVLGKGTTLLKKTYREARGETVVDDEDKVKTPAAVRLIQCGLLICKMSAIGLSGSSQSRSVLVT